MMFSFFLCALWTNFFVTAFDNYLGYDCRRNDFDSIHLPTSNHLKSRYHANILDSLNKKLRDKCDNYYDFKDIDLTLKPPFYYIRKYINLFDPHYNEKQIEKDKFVYAGDINVYGDKTEAYVNVANFTLNKNGTTESEGHNKKGTTDPGEHNKKGTTDPGEHNTSTECKNNTKDIWNIERINVLLQAVKLVTSHIESHYNDLYNFITSIQYHSENNITTRASCMPFATEPAEFKFVLICSDTISCFDLKPYSRQLKFIFKQTRECEDSMEMFKDSMLAVIAPEPFKISYETTVPAIFYTSFTDSKYESQFVNSLNLVSDEPHFLKHAFLKFIRQSGWRRVAIISDFAPNSIEFEKELSELFYEEGILHKVEYGDNREEFKKAIQNLHKVDTRIVIANVNKKNAVKLAQLAIHDRDQPGLVFLFRVPPAWDKENQRLISISLGVANNHPCKINGQYNSYCSGILEGLRIVATADLDFNYNTKTSKKDFYRKFKENMKTLQESKFEATVARSLSSPIFTMSIDQSGILNTYKHNPSKPTFDKEIQDEKSCHYKSNNFDKPCDPLPLLFIMLVVMMFAILVLILTCYFHNTSPLNSTIYEQL